MLLGIEGVGEVRARRFRNLFVDGRVGDRRGKFALGLAGELHQLADAGGDLLAALVAEFDGAQDVLFGDLLCARFHHHDAALGSGDHDVQLGFAAFRIRRIGHILAVFETHPHTAQDMRERNIGHGQRRAGADNRQGIGILLGVGGEDHGDNLGFVEETVGKQRADRTIDQPAGENLFFGGTPLAFDETARNLAGGVSVFTIVYGEREKSSSRFRIVSHAGGD